MKSKKFHQQIFWIASVMLKNLEEGEREKGGGGVSKGRRGREEEGEGEEEGEKPCGNGGE